ncbi:hypothetical protein [Streptomyces sp. NPDC056549]|uniref:hypothetical protein n=1 Tax=Streptomyces sp. NPDC056549 TaxID=3345864 RepID=UPI0036D05BB1
MQSTSQPPNIPTLLGALADRLDSKYAGKAVDERLVLAQCLVVADAAYGNTAAAETAERALVDALPPILHGDTRAGYATRCRLTGQQVSA